MRILRSSRAPVSPTPPGRYGLPGIMGMMALIGSIGCQPQSPPVLGGAAAAGFLNAIRLALEDHERAFGSLPPMDTVLLVQGSNRAAPSLQTAQELTAIPGLVAVIGHASSPSSLASSQVYNRHRVVQIAPTSTAPLYSEAGPYSFRMVASDIHQGPFLADHLSRFLPEGGRLALLFVNDDYGRGLRETFLGALDRDRFEVILDLPHTEGDVHELDVTHHVDALIATAPDLIVWLGRNPGLGAILPELRRQGREIPVLGSDGVSRASLLSFRGTYWSGVHFVDFLDVGATAELRDFHDRFRRRFGAEAGGGEVLSYDAARIVIAAIAGGARTSDEVREYLLSLGGERPAFPGVGGPVRFDERGDVEPSYVLLPIEPRPQP